MTTHLAPSSNILSPQPVPISNFDYLIRYVKDCDMPQDPDHLIKSASVPMTQCNNGLSVWLFRDNNILTIRNGDANLAAPGANYNNYAMLRADEVLALDPNGVRILPAPKNIPNIGHLHYDIHGLSRQTRDKLLILMTRYKGKV